MDEPERFWRMKHCYRPMDQLWFASPWHFPKDSPILGPVLSELRCFFEKRKEQYTRGSGTNVAYNYAMRIVHAKIVETGLVCDILEPSVMSPIPYWRHDWFVCPTALQAPREENYHRIQSVADIMKSSIGVIPFLHSTKPNANAQGDSGTARAHTTATVVAKGSLLHEVYSALGLELVGGKLPMTFWHGVVKIAPRRKDAAGPVSGDVEPPRKRSKTLANTRGCGGTQRQVRQCASCQPSPAQRSPRLLCRRPPALASMSRSRSRPGHLSAKVMRETLPPCRDGHATPPTPAVAGGALTR